MSVIPVEIMAYCSFCPWELACASEAEAAKRKTTHEHARHNVPIPAQELAGADWQSQAVEAVRKVAARGEDFTVYDALREYGIGDPPNAKTALGRFGRLVHDMHIAHPVTYAPSNRGQTKRSAAAVWNRNQARCVHVNCRAKVGAA